MEEEGVIDTKRKLVFFKSQQQPEKTENVPKIDVCVVAIFFGCSYYPEAGSLLQNNKIDVCSGKKESGSRDTN